MRKKSRQTFILADSLTFTTEVSINMNDLTNETLQFLGIVIGLFSIFSLAEKGSILFWVTGISAIFFSIVLLPKAINLIKSAF